MNMHNFSKDMKAYIYHMDDIGEICDEKILHLLNKFLKDHVLNLFISDGSLFDKKLNLSDFFFSFDKENKNIIDLHISNDIKETIRKILGRNKIQININL